MIEERIDELEEKLKTLEDKVNFHSCQPADRIAELIAMIDLLVYSLRGYAWGKGTLLDEIGRRSRNFKVLFPAIALRAPTLRKRKAK